MYQASWHFESPRTNLQWNTVVHGAEKRFLALFLVNYNGAGEALVGIPEV